MAKDKRRKKRKEKKRERVYLKEIQRYVQEAAVPIVRVGVRRVAYGSKGRGRRRVSE